MGKKLLNLSSQGKHFFANAGQEEIFLLPTLLHINHCCVIKPRNSFAKQIKHHTEMLTVNYKKLEQQFY